MDVYSPKAQSGFPATNGDAANWMRLAAVLAIASYLEVYLRAAVSTALHSDPGRLIGASRAVDGASLLKRSATPHIDLHVTPTAEGTWPDRVKALERLFCPLAPSLTALVGDLDAMRRLRNSVGHHFGRDAQSVTPFVQAEHRMERLSEQRLLKWMKVAYDFANGLDALLLPHIGEYEALRFYHHWRQSYRGNLMEERTTFQTAAKPMLGFFGGGPTYFRELIAYYKAL